MEITDENYLLFFPLINPSVTENINLFVKNYISGREHARQQSSGKSRIGNDYCKRPASVKIYF